MKEIVCVGDKLVNVLKGKKSISIGFIFSCEQNLQMNIILFVETPKDGHLHFALSPFHTSHPVFSKGDSVLPLSLLTL